MYNKLEYSMNFWNILTVNIMDINNYIIHILYIMHYLKIYCTIITMLRWITLSRLRDNYKTV